VQQNGANLATAFRYQMDVQIVPFVNIAPDTTNYELYANLDGANSPQCLIRSNRWEEVNIGAYTNESIYLQPAPGNLVYSCLDVRLHFSWPVIVVSAAGANASANDVVGPGRQNYRTTISSALVEGAHLPDGAQLWFFQPQLYANAPTLLDN